MFFVEEKGIIFVENTSQVALKRIQDGVKDEVPIIGFKTKDEVVSYIKALCKED